MNDPKPHIHSYDAETGETVIRELSQEEIDALAQATNETPSPS